MDVVTAGPARLVEWARLRAALWPGEDEAHHRREIRAVLDGPERFVAFLAIDARSQAVGLAEASLRYDYVNGCATSPVAFLEGLFVRERARRRGVGRALCDAVARWGASMGCTELASDAAHDNGPSRRFHAAFGFSETETVVFFAKTLTPRQ